MNADPQAIEQFQTDFNRVVKTAIESNVPPENIILALDSKHTDVVMLRKHIIAQQIAAEAAQKIVPANRLPSN